MNNKGKWYLVYIAAAGGREKKFPLQAKEVDAAVAEAKVMMEKSTEPTHFPAVTYRIEL